MNEVVNTRRPDAQRSSTMTIPIVLPELGADDEPICISCWLVDLSEAVDAGDRVVEVRLEGITFDVAAPAAGILTGIDKTFDMQVLPGDILGWIEPADQETSA
jgi:pyruvate/2-oxoglutarate dehydrogenase complex dihydrolipoamide acyltransferase (E2) component